MSVEQLLLFNETVMSYEIEVVIIDDGIAEPNEYFLALLTLVDPQLPDKVTISPDLATVTIVDGKSQIPIHQCCHSQCSYSSMGTSKGLQAPMSVYKPSVLALFEASDSVCVVNSCVRGLYNCASNLSIAERFVMCSIKFTNRLY